VIHRTAEGGPDHAAPGGPGRESARAHPQVETSEPIGASATQEGKPRAGPSVAAALVWLDLLMMNESMNAVSVVLNGLACAPEILSTYQHAVTRRVRRPWLAWVYHGLDRSNLVGFVANQTGDQRSRLETTRKRKRLPCPCPSGAALHGARGRVL